MAGNDLRLVGARAKRLLMALAMADAARRYRTELAEQVRAYEERFGIPSSEIHDAIDRGELRETLDVCQWIIAAEQLGLIERRCRERGWSFTRIGTALGVGRAAVSGWARGLCAPRPRASAASASRRRRDVAA